LPEEEEDDDEKKIYCIFERRLTQKNKRGFDNYIFVFNKQIEIIA